MAGPLVLLQGELVAGANAKKKPGYQKVMFRRAGFSVKSPMTRFFVLMSALLFAVSASAGQIEPEQLENLPPADVVFLGEVHDNPAHHENQARALRALKPSAVVFEMLTPEQADRLGGASLKDRETLETLLGWRESGWPDFGMYFPVFQATEGVVIFGGNLPRAEVRRAISEGAASVFVANASRFGLDQALPETQQAEREKEQMEAHCNALPETLLGGMVQAQRLRDAVLAAAVVEARQQTAGRVVVITGNGHARTDWGVPALLNIAAPDLSILSFGQFELEQPEKAPFDVFLITKQAERDDPCAVFRKN